MNIGKLFLILLCTVLLFGLAACTNSNANLEVSEKIMLGVECGWQEPPKLPNNPEGILVITDSLDDYKKEHTFTGIRSPEIVEEPSLFNGKAMKIGRYWKFGEPTDNIMHYANFVSIKEDYKYLEDSLNDLSFSSEPSERFWDEFRVVIWTYDDKLNAKYEYLICADGIVGRCNLEERGERVYYESLTPVDYYQFSALQIKYTKRTNNIYWKFHEVDDPHKYKLCISGPNVHRDFTLEEAEELLYSLTEADDIKNIQIGTTVNHPAVYSPDTYIKITEYYCPYYDDETKVELQTFYLAPDGTLRRDFVEANLKFYENSEIEHFEASFMSVSIEKFDYVALLRLLQE